MLFDARAALARIRAADPADKTQMETDPRAKRANRAKPDTDSPPNLAHLARLARPQPSEPKNATPPNAPVIPLHGRMVRLDWSGEWVSRDRWDAMSDFERHGPQGRLFCGKCWRWQDRDTALACLDGEACE